MERVVQRKKDFRAKRIALEDTIAIVISAGDAAARRRPPKKLNRWCGGGE
jgi:hypothetical protein